MRSRFICLIFIFSSLAQAADKVEVAFQHALQLEKSSRYEEALLEFQEIEQNFPYSKYARKSKLKIADVHFQMSNYAQAQYQYQYYFDLYPKHQDSDYALFRAGESLHKQLPKTIDRDLSNTSEVLKFWRSVLVKFPGTKYTKKILENQKKLIRNLGKKELYIASFYLKKKNYISAQKRFNKLFNQYPSFRTDKKALTKAVLCAKALNDEPAVAQYKAWMRQAI